MNGFTILRNLARIFVAWFAVLLDQTTRQSGLSS